MHYNRINLLNIKQQFKNRYCLYVNRSSTECYGDMLLVHAPSSHDNRNDGGWSRRLHRIRKMDEEEQPLMDEEEQPLMDSRETSESVYITTYVSLRGVFPTGLVSTLIRFPLQCQYFFSLYSRTNDQKYCIVTFPSSKCIIRCYLKPVSTHILFIFQIHG